MLDCNIKSSRRLLRLKKKKPRFLISSPPDFAPCWSLESLQVYSAFTLFYSSWGGGSNQSHPSWPSSPTGTVPVKELLGFHVSAGCGCCLLLLCISDALFVLHALRQTCTWINSLLNPKMTDNLTWDHFNIVLLTLCCLLHVCCCRRCMLK